MEVDQARTGSNGLPTTIRETEWLQGHRPLIVGKGGRIRNDTKCFSLEPRADGETCTRVGAGWDFANHGQGMTTACLIGSAASWWKLTVSLMIE